MSEYTPGTWIPAKASTTPYEVVTQNGREDGGPEVVAHVYHADDTRLIAAAPDLLEALRDLVARCDGDEGVRADGSNIDTAWAHAAIAKAEGGDA